MANSAVIIKVDGTIGVTEYDEKKNSDLLSDTVGGWLQVVPLPNLNAQMWLNEEGKLERLPINPVATRLWEREYGRTDVIVGDVVLLSGVDENGETVGFSPEDRDKLFVTLLSI